MGKNSGFFLKVHGIMGCEHLVLCYSNSIAKTSTNHERDEKFFLINSFFDPFDELENYVANEYSRERELSLEEFYERLRQSHINDDLESGIPSDVIDNGIPGLRPVLRPYQKRGIKWMLKRELKIESLPSPFIRLRSKFNENQIMFFNKFTQDLLSVCPEQEQIPRGGLLTG